MNSHPVTRTVLYFMIFNKAYVHLNYIVEHFYITVSDFFVYFIVKCFADCISLTAAMLGDESNVKLKC